MLLVVLACLILGVGFVATAQRGSSWSASLERIGGGLVVAGLVGLGLLLTRAN